MERRRAGWGAAGTEGRLLFQRRWGLGWTPPTPAPPPHPVPPPAAVQVLVVPEIVKCLSRRDAAQEYVKVSTEFLRPESFRNLKVSPGVKSEGDLHGKATCAPIITAFPEVQHTRAGCILNLSKDEEEFRSFMERSGYPAGYKTFPRVGSAGTASPYRCQVLLAGGLGFTRGQPCEPSELSCYRLVRKVNALSEIDGEVVGTVADTVAVRVFYLSQ